MPEPRIIVPPTIKKEPELYCHRFFAPVVFPQADPIVPNKVIIDPKMGNFNCVKDKCMLWNKEDRECYDVTAAKAQKVTAEYAFNKMNDVHIQGGVV